MPIDRWQLLAWMADREDRETGMPTLFGSDFLAKAAAAMAGGDSDAWDAVARTTVHLKRLGHLDWSYVPVPNVDRPEPPLEFIDNAFIQRVQGIHVTDKGLAALAARRQADGAMQVNITNSTVGQLALGDIKNVDIFVILDAMERSLDSVAASPEEKEAARGAIRRMRDSGEAVATSAAGSVLGAALRHAFGMP